MLGAGNPATRDNSQSYGPWEQEKPALVRRFCSSKGKLWTGSKASTSPKPAPHAPSGIVYKQMAKLLSVILVLLIASPALAQKNAEGSSAEKLVSITVGALTHLRAGVAYERNLLTVKARYVRQFHFDRHTAPNETADELGVLAGITAYKGAFGLSALAGLGYVQGTRQGRFLYNDYERVHIVPTGFEIWEYAHFQPINYSAIGVPVEVSFWYGRRSTKWGFGLTGTSNFNPQQVQWGALVDVLYRIKLH